MLDVFLMSGIISPFQCYLLLHSSKFQLTWQSNRTYRNFRRNVKRVKNINGVGVTTTVFVVRAREVPAAGATSPYRMLSTGSGSKEPFFEKEKRDVYRGRMLNLNGSGREKCGNELLIEGRTMWDRRT